MKKGYFFGAVVCLFAVSCQHGSFFGKFSDRPRSFDNRSAKVYLKEHNVSRLPSFDVPVEVNERVVAWVDYFSGVQRDRFQRYLDRSALYVDWMRPILKEEGVPSDLVFLPMIESGFTVQARSRARAVGAWQFIPSTGKLYGLRQNSWVDERKDPEKSARAAAQYLKKLYGDFDDWYLALAAYNAGEGKVARAIRRGESRNYWHLTSADSHLFRPETKDYVPKYLAALIISKMPEKFGFRAPNYSKQQMQFDTVILEDAMELRKLAKLAGTDEEEMHALNPELLRRVTPPGSYFLRIPTGRKAVFEVAYAAMPKEERRVRLADHRVHRGETLGKIARHYGVSVSDLMAANGIHNPRHLKVGKVLVIPYEGVSKKQRVSHQKKSVSSTGGTYVVQRGDSLGKISNRFRVSVAELKSINGLQGNIIRVGQKIRVREAVASTQEPVLLASVKDSVKETTSVNATPPVVKLQPEQNTGEVSTLEVAGVGTNVDSTTETTQTYVVQSGDTLWNISQKHNVPIRSLKALNNLRNNHLQPGTTLTLR